MLVRCEEYRKRIKDFSFHARLLMFLTGTPALTALGNPGHSNRMGSPTSATRWGVVVDTEILASMSLLFLSLSVFVCTVVLRVLVLPTYSVVPIGA